MPWIKGNQGHAGGVETVEREERATGINGQGSALAGHIVVAPQIQHDEVARIASELVETWREHTGDGVYRGTTFTIDLNEPAGRSEMLVLSVLMAAMVRGDVVERTFLTLRQNDLLLPERLSAASEEDRRLALKILRTQYRTVTSKASKVEAIYNNQAMLDRHWDGDLHNIYLQHAGDDTGLISTLQSFSHLKSRAFWLVREMKVQGLWSQVGAHATEFYDSHVRRVLQRLGFVVSDMSDPWKVARQECENWVSTWFDSDVTPLYLHGSRLCIHDDRDVCSDKCPVKGNCSFWAG